MCLQSRGTETDFHFLLRWRFLSAPRQLANKWNLVCRLAPLLFTTSRLWRRKCLQPRRAKHVRNRINNCQRKRWNLFLLFFFLLFRDIMLLCSWHQSLDRNLFYLDQIEDSKFFEDWILDMKILFEWNVDQGSPTWSLGSPGSPHGQLKAPVEDVLKIKLVKKKKTKIN